MALVATMPGGAALAQAVPDSVPVNTQELRDFRIDTPAPTPPPVAEVPPVPAPTPEPVPTPAPVAAPVAIEPVRPAARTPRRQALRRTSRTPVPVTAREPAPVATTQPDTLPETVPVVAAPPPAAAPVSQVGSAAPGPPAASPVAEPEPDNSLWIGLALAAALGLLVVGLLSRRKRIVPIFDEPVATELPEPQPVAVTDPEPEPTPAAAVALAEPIGMPQPARPQLDIAFTPAAAGATDAQASVDYSLVVTNTGDAPASKVRMEARMFAMGQDHDAALAAFFAEPLEKPTPIASAVPPGVHAALRAQVTLARDAVRPIQVRDRTVFVPLVAFNLLYEWYDADGGLQHGQTAMSYVVGRENRPPAEKMAPFRLDQGPKIYREVGQRVHQLKQVA